MILRLIVAFMVNPGLELGTLVWRLSNSLAEIVA